MNIRDYWDNLPVEPYQNDTPTWNALLDRRVETYRGFTTVERERGFLKPEVSINTSAGQEMVRILLFRTLEEIGESYLSEEPDHVREEAVDAVNYLLAIHALDPKATPRSLLIPALMKAASQPNPGFWNTRMSRERIGELTVLLGGELGDCLRNRAWMEHAQDTYFSGQTTLLRAIRETMKTLIFTCENFDQFCRYYITKDEVLQFRLRSHY